MSDKKRELPDWTEIDWDAVDLEELINIPSEEEIAACHTFSPEFEANMEKMFRDAGIEFHTDEKAGKPEAQEKAETANTLEDVGEFGVFDVRGDSGTRKRKGVGKRHGRRFRIFVTVACLLVAISVGTVTRIRSEAVPHLVIEVFQTWYEDFVEVTWGSNQKESGRIEVREPGYLPEGYELVEKIEDPNYYSLIYENEQGNEIEIQGKTLISGLLNMEDRETLITESLEIKGIICKVGTMQDGGYFGTWEQDDAVYNVFVSSGKEETKKIIETMIEK